MKDKVSVNRPAAQKGTSLPLIISYCFLHRQNEREKGVPEFLSFDSRYLLTDVSIGPMSALLGMLGLPRGTTVLIAFDSLFTKRSGLQSER